MSYVFIETGVTTLKRPIFRRDLTRKKLLFPRLFLNVFNQDRNRLQNDLRSSFKHLNPGRAFIEIDHPPEFLFGIILVIQRENA